MRIEDMENELLEIREKLHQARKQAAKSELFVYVVAGLGLWLGMYAYDQGHGFLSGLCIGAFSVLAWITVVTPNS